MQIIIILLLTLIAPEAIAEEIRDTKELLQSDFDQAAEDNHSPRDLRRLHKQKKKDVDTDLIISRIEESFAMEDQTDAAERVDQALQNLFVAANVVLKHYGHDKAADKMLFEYNMFYVGAVARIARGEKEIGDFPGLSPWLTKQHEIIEDNIGEFLCVWFHLHDVFIFNHAIPVVFAPKSYDLDEYRIHFAGHLIWGWFWKSHGLAGVCAYWSVNLVCGGFTSGMGLITYACGPISGFAENMMDKYIAPPISESIWKKANGQ